MFSKIDHVGIAVPDLDAAIAFYRDTFGIVSVHEETNEEQGVREVTLRLSTLGSAERRGEYRELLAAHLRANAASLSEDGVREAMLSVGDGSTRIQLLAPLTPESTIAKFINRSGPGVQQVAYTVQDIDAVSAQLRAKGLRLLYDSPRRGTSNSRVNFIHPKDAGGILVELVEPAA